MNTHTVMATARGVVISHDAILFWKTVVTWRSQRAGHNDLWKE